MNNKMILIEEIKKEVIKEKANDLWGAKGKVADVARKAGIKDPNLIYPGQEINIDGTPVIVKEDDTLGQIILDSRKGKGPVIESDPELKIGDLSDSLDKIADTLVLSTLYDRVRPEKEKEISEEELEFREREVEAREDEAQSRQIQNYRDMLRDRIERLFPEKYARR